MSPVIEFRYSRLDTPSDRQFVLDGWLQSFKRSQYAGIIPNNRFGDVLDMAIEQLLDRGMTILVAESREPDTSVGFIAYETASIPVLHYIYVKPILRGIGFGKALLRQAGITLEAPFLYTFRTPDMRKIKGGTHCPAVARRKNLEPIHAVDPHKGSKSR